MNKINILEDVLIVGGITISLVDIQTVLGIIILSVQLVLILIKGGKRIYDAIKNKNNDELQDAIKDTQEEIESLKEKNNVRK